MKAQLSLVTPPATEPLSLVDAKKSLRVDYSYDDDLITSLIVAARQAVESYTHRALVTQEWLYEMDEFPQIHPLYQRRGFPQIIVPKPPLQSIVSCQYVDTSGNLQPLPQQTDYGRDSSPLYGYQLMPGSDTQPARLLPAWARPWPPVRLVAGCVQLDFIAGYCDADYVSIAAGELGTITGFTFPQSDNGDLIYVPGAGPAGTRLVATLVVDQNGNGTITPAASGPVTNALAFVGGEVPPEIIQAMKQYVAFLYQRRGDDALPPNANEYPPAFEALLSPLICHIV